MGYNNSINIQAIYQRYLQAFKKGVYNYIKDTDTPNGGSVPRKYFSGGVVGRITPVIEYEEKINRAQISTLDAAQLIDVDGDLSVINQVSSPSTSKEFAGILRQEGVNMDRVTAETLDKVKAVLDSDKTDVEIQAELKDMLPLSRKKEFSLAVSRVLKSSNGSYWADLQRILNRTRWYNQILSRDYLNLYKLTGSYVPGYIWGHLPEGRIFEWQTKQNGRPLCVFDKTKIVHMTSEQLQRIWVQAYEINWYEPAQIGGLQKGLFERLSADKGGVFYREVLDKEVNIFENVFRNDLGIVPADAEHMKVLEAAAGFGALSYVMASWGAQAVVLDGGKLWLEIAKKYIHKKATEEGKDGQVLPRISYTLDRLSDMSSVPDGRFDMVFLSEVFHYLPQGLAQVAVKNMMNKLRQGGKLIIFEEIQSNNKRYGQWLENADLHAYCGLKEDVKIEKKLASNMMIITIHQTSGRQSDEAMVGVQTSRIEEMTWDNETHVLRLYRAFLTEHNWPLPRVLHGNGQPVTRISAKPLNIADLRKLAKGRSPQRYLDDLELSIDGRKFSTDQYSFRQEFGIMPAHQIWFGNMEQISRVADFVRTIPGDVTPRILIHAAWNGEDAFALAMALDHLFPQRHFEIFARDILLPNPNELNWIKKVKIPEYLRSDYDHYFNDETSTVASIKPEAVERLGRMIHFAQGDVRDGNSFENNLDVVIVNHVLGQSVSEATGISQALDNAWDSLRVKGRLFIDNTRYQKYPQQQLIVRDILRDGFAGKFREIMVDEYEKIGNGKADGAMLALIENFLNEHNVASGKVKQIMDRLRKHEEEIADAKGSIDFRDRYIGDFYKGLQVMEKSGAGPEEIRKFMELLDADKLFIVVREIKKPEDFKKLLSFHRWLGHIIGDEGKAGEVLRNIYSVDPDMIRRYSDIQTEGGLEKIKSFLADDDLLGEEVVASCL